MSKRPADGRYCPHLCHLFSSFLVSPHFRARATTRSVDSVSFVYECHTPSQVCWHIRPVILKKADERRLHRPSSTFSQKRRDNRAPKIKPKQLSFQSILLDWAVNNFLGCWDVREARSDGSEGSKMFLDRSEFKRSRAKRGYWCLWVGLTQGF